MVKKHSQQPPTAPEATKDRAPGAAAELGEQIGHKLREMFNDVVTEPVPEKFRSLLEELDRKADKD